MSSLSRALAVALALSGAACWDETVSRPPLQEGVLPSKDELLRVDGRAFSLSDYSTLQTQIPDQTQETLIKIGATAIHLVPELQSRDSALGLGDALALCQYVWAPKPQTQADRARAESVLSKLGWKNPAQELERRFVDAKPSYNTPLLEALRRGG